MKNLFAVLLASLMLFSFAACSSETDSSSDTNQSNVETVTTDEESGSDSTEETTDETDSETGTDASDETGTDATDETGTDATDETGTNATGTTDETASDSAEETAGTAEQQTITGTILDATMSTVTIQTEDGEELSFSIPDDADETEVDGMTVGDTLEITYTGTIDGTDTSGATVVKLVQTSAQ
ncbi:MAG TPA: hypothetical protein H9999_08230 [Candidatus Negativibacillus faecipullorum]|nr:hypothetical protein [Candidatus Negativibacillus faecipullorum]